MQYIILAGVICGIYLLRCDAYDQGYKAGIQLQCYFGSSTYTSTEMATLIDGVISECKDMGIETATPAELARMMGEWGK